MKRSAFIAEPAKMLASEAGNHNHAISKPDARICREEVGIALPAEAQTEFSGDSHLIFHANFSCESNIAPCKLWLL
ncbi:MAG: hypothetical protein A2Z88_00265 [Omnitrophica WOR_2 bacterium GWA2_47_8]|nr:MAG: hypothetical protein A2Z88_00265 [Omnitrophica WOR_2 bacterium GWA2_47_8]